MFTDCHWENNVGEGLENWTGVMLLRGTTQRNLAWMQRRHWKQLKKELVIAMYRATIYYTWQARY